MSRVVTFDERTVQDFALFRTVERAYFAEFCRIGLQFLQQGMKRGLLTQAAGKLGVDPAALEAAVLALTQVLLTAAKAEQHSEAFAASIAELQLPTELGDDFVAFFGEHKEAIRAALQALEVPLPELLDISWRLDVELGRRMLHHTMEPTFVMRVDTRTGDAEQSVLLQSDMANLRLLRAELQAAVAENKGTHCQRIQRYVR